MLIFTASINRFWNSASLLFQNQKEYIFLVFFPMLILHVNPSDFFRYFFFWDPLRLVPAISKIYICFSLFGFIPLHSLWVLTRKKSSFRRRPRKKARKNRTQRSHTSFLNLNPDFFLMFSLSCPYFMNNFNFFFVPMGSTLKKPLFQEASKGWEGQFFFFHFLSCTIKDPFFNAAVWLRALCWTCEFFT